MQNPSSVVPLDAIKNTKQATTFLTLGLSLARPGIFITYDEDNRRSSGGVAHFLFETNVENTVAKYAKIYQEGTADVILDEFLGSLRGQVPDPVLAELETKIAEALIVYGKKLLDNYNVVVRALKDDIAKFVVTKGEPVYSGGKIVGLQNFTVRGVK